MWEIAHDRLRNFVFVVSPESFETLFYVGLLTGLAGIETERACFLMI